MQIGMQLSITRAGGQLTLTQQALSVLRKYGTDAHLWMPGVGYVNGVTAGNWIDSAGTQAGAVDQPVGLVFDAFSITPTYTLTKADLLNPVKWGDGGPTVTDLGNGAVRIQRNSTGLYVSSISKVGQFTVPVGWHARMSARLSANRSGFKLSGEPYVGWRDNSGGWSFDVTTTPTTFAANLATNKTASDLASGSSSVIRFQMDLIDGTGLITDYIDVHEFSFEIFRPAAIQTTTSAKPILRRSSGRYSWQFDGTDDRFTLSPPYSASDSYAVITSATIDASGATRSLWFAGPSSGNGRAGTLFYGSTLGVLALWRDDTSAATTQLSLGTVTQNVPFVLSARKTGTSVQARVNATNTQSGSTAAHGATTVNTANIGSLQSSLYHNGHIYPVIAIKGTVSDVDLLTLEKFVGACSGVTI